MAIEKFHHFSLVSDDMVEERNIEGESFGSHT